MVALAAAAPAAGKTLRADQVLVVANAKAEGSVPLGKYYCMARGVGQDRLLVIRATAAADTERREYEDAIRAPVRRFLAKNDPAGEIRCIVLMWGVPVRVLGRPMPAGRDKVIKAYNMARRRLGARLSVNIRLLDLVAARFPAPRTQTLRPLGHLFPAGTVGTPKTGGTYETLRDKFAARLSSKNSAAGRLTDPAQRTIALRQIAALRLDGYGARGLLKALPAERISGVPSAERLRKQIEAGAFELARLTSGRDTPEKARAAIEVALRLHGAVGTMRFCEARAEAADTANEDAAVDSELAMLWDEGANLKGWRLNPMNWRVRASTTKPAGLPRRALMTARIDGPSAADALRIIKDSIAGEKVPLKGTFYIDAGGKYPEKYDWRLRNLRKMLVKHTKLPVKFEDSKALFGSGRCPDAAMYVGWYSLQNYIPAFTWVRGSVAWHVASLEAMHLRNPASNEWCVKMIQNGVAATLGAVNEPFLHAFPPPEEFYALLLTGRYTVGQCYWRTVPHVSWRMTLLADPLYNPFGRFPQLSIYDLPPQLSGLRVRATTRPSR